jgi:hypothetical protein
MQINFMLLSHSRQMTFWRGLGEKFIARQMMMYLRFKMTIATVGGWVAADCIYTFSVVVVVKPKSVSPHGHRNFFQIFSFSPETE